MTAPVAPSVIDEATLAQVRHRVLSTAEQLYKSATQEAERAEMALEEFDRASEVALVEASAAVQMVRAALRTSGEGDRLVQLEAELLLAEATELTVLDARIKARKPHEDAWRAAATGVCLWGGTLLRAAAEPRTVTNIHSMSPREFAEQLLKVVPAANGSEYPAGRES